MAFDIRRDTVAYVEPGGSPTDGERFDAADHRWVSLSPTVRRSPSLYSTMSA